MVCVQAEPLLSKYFFNTFPILFLILFKNRIRTVNYFNCQLNENIYVVPTTRLSLASSIKDAGVLYPLEEVVGAISHRHPEPMLWDLDIAHEVFNPRIGTNIWPYALQSAKVWRGTDERSRGTPLSGQALRQKLKFPEWRDTTGEVQVTKIGELVLIVSWTRFQPWVAQSACHVQSLRVCRSHESEQTPWPRDKLRSKLAAPRDLFVTVNIFYNTFPILL